MRGVAARAGSTGTFIMRRNSEASHRRCPQFSARISTGGLLRPCGPSSSTWSSRSPSTATASCNSAHRLVRNGVASGLHHGTAGFCLSLFISSSNRRTSFQTKRLTLHPVPSARTAGLHLQITACPDASESTSCKGARDQFSRNSPQLKGGEGCLGCCSLPGSFTRGMEVLPSHWYTAGTKLLRTPPSAHF